MRSKPPTTAAAPEIAQGMTGAGSPGIRSPRTTADATGRRWPKFRRLLPVLPVAVWGWPALAQSSPWAHTTNNGTVTITRYFGRDTDVVVPESLNGWPVVRVADGAFQFGPAQYATRSITFPTAITNIGVAEFNSYQQLTHVTFLGPITRIPNGAFINCRNLVSITYPDRVTSIGDDAFQGCRNLAAISFPNGVTHIGPRAFLDCAALTYIRIPASVTSIGFGAFAGCTSLEAIEVDPLNAQYSSREGVLFNHEQTALLQCPGGKTGAFVIPDGVTSLPESGFAGCRRLTAVTVPDSVTTLGRRVFADCSVLGELTLPESIQAIPNGAFWGCTKLVRMELPAGVTSIGSQAFGLSGLTNLVIPVGVTAIQEETFRDCPALVSVTVPESVRSIGQQAFARCPSLAEARISKNVTTLHTSAFMDCTNLTAITVDEANPSFASVDGIVFNKSLNTLHTYPAGRPGDYVIPASVRSISDTAFSGAAHLEAIVIPDTVTSLGAGSFQNCIQLVSVRIGRGITVIPNGAFSGCLRLTDVQLPDTLRSISDYAFGWCRDLRRIVIPGSVRTLGTGVFDPYPYGDEWPPATVAQVYFEGNVPTAGMQALGLQPFEWGPTVYYRAGTTGWREEFAGRPTVLWDPRVAFDASFGVREGQFGFTLTSAPGLVIVVEAANDLERPVWSVVGTLTLEAGQAVFRDPGAADGPARFYRFRSP